MKIIKLKEYKVKKNIELLESLILNYKDSRNNIKRLLKNKQVLVNGVARTQFNLNLVKDDIVTIIKEPIKDPKEKFQRSKKPNIYLPFEILYQDNEFIAINKPSGLLSICDDSFTKDSAYKILVNYLKDNNIKKEIYLLHRIDKETSGILLFTFSKYIHSKLKLNWNDYVLKREYEALVEGIFDKKEDIIINYLQKNELNNLMYVSKNNEGQKSITEYKVLKEFKDFSYLIVNLKTGRKNQIRAVFSNLNHPVCGDVKYKSTKDPLKRLALNHTKLIIKHPFNDKIIKIQSNYLSIFRLGK